MGFFEDTIKALNDAGIHNVVGGDLAVVLHGYVRQMPERDWSIHVCSDDVEQASELLAASKTHGISLVADEKDEFAELIEESVSMSLESTRVCVMALDRLIALKRQEGRPYSRVDADYLEAISQELAGVSPQPRDGWEEHAQDQMRSILRATPAKRLAVFEGLIEFARRYAGVGSRPSSAAGLKSNET